MFYPPFQKIRHFFTSLVCLCIFLAINLQCGSKSGSNTDIRIRNASAKPVVLIYKQEAVKHHFGETFEYNSMHYDLVLPNQDTRITSKWDPIELDADIFVVQDGKLKAHDFDFFPNSSDAFKIGTDPYALEIFDTFTKDTEAKTLGSDEGSLLIHNQTSDPLLVIYPIHYTVSGNFQSSLNVFSTQYSLIQASENTFITPSDKISEQNITVIRLDQQAELSYSGNIQLSIQEVHFSD